MTKVTLHYDLERKLTEERLRQAQGGDFERVAPELLPAVSNEYGQLLRGYNDLVDAISEQEALAARWRMGARMTSRGRGHMALSVAVSRT